MQAFHARPPPPGRTFAGSMLADADPDIWLAAAGPDIWLAAAGPDIWLAADERLEAGLDPHIWLAAAGFVADCRDPVHSRTRRSLPGESPPLSERSSPDSALVSENKCGRLGIGH